MTDTQAQATTEVAPEIPAPYLGYSEVRADWLDANGHMNVAHYLSAFDDGSCPMFDALGLGWDYTAAGHGSIFIASSSIDFRRELLDGDRLMMTTCLLGYDKRRVHVYQQLFHRDKSYLAAQAEFVMVHVSLQSRRAAEMPASALAGLAAIKVAHAGLERSPFVGRALGLDWRPAT